MLRNALACVTKNSPTYSTSYRLRMYVGNITLLGSVDVRNTILFPSDYGVQDPSEKVHTNCPPEVKLEHLL